jgi:hypothetical protein
MTAEAAYRGDYLGRMECEEDERDDEQRRAAAGGRPGLPSGI